MNKVWADDGWKHYLYWQEINRRNVRRINDLLKSIERDGLLKGNGNPEKLRYREGFSRLIDGENRLVYAVDEKGNLVIIACKGHYED